VGSSHKFIGATKHYTECRRRASDRDSGYDNPFQEGCAMKKILWLLPWVALALSGSDLTGKWSGTIEIADEGATTPVSVQLVQKADVVSGKIGRTGGGEEESIRNGKVDGKKVSFEVNSAHGLMKFALTLEEDRLEGEMKGTVDDGEIVGKVKLAREKAGAAQSH
jgi:hypothetical protein